MRENHGTTPISYLFAPPSGQGGGSGTVFFLGDRLNFTRERTRQREISMSLRIEPSRKILSRLATAAAALTFSAGVVLAQAPQNAPAQGGGMDHGAMGHG